MTCIWDLMSKKVVVKMIFLHRLEEKVLLNSNTL